MARVYILIFILFILGGIGYGAYYIYNDTMQRMAVLRENNAKLEVALDSKDTVIEELQNNMQKQIELSNELNEKLAAVEKENTRIRDKLAEGNLVADSLKDPKVMEKKINEEVSNIFGTLSDSTK
jgi:septal ring factor EnvC (AmiA/AmiB activator)